MKKFSKKWIALLASAALCFSLAACTSGEEKKPSNDVASTPAPSSEASAKDSGKEAPAAAISKVGVSMPTKDIQRWTQDGENMVKNLKAAGFEVDLQFANNDIAQQVTQIENMLTGGCNALVISAIDGSSLTTVLDKAKSAGVTVISYDRLIMNSNAVSYYATFDLEKVGVQQGEYIVKKLDLEKQAGPFNIELFTGSPDDNNVVFFFGGAMKVLQPYIDNGKLVVKSGQTTREACATPNWSTEEAQKRMENVISAFYNDGSQLDAVLCSNDSVAQGVANALASNYKGNYPVVTGQDCEIASVKNILAGKQSMSVFKDTRSLAKQVSDMLIAIKDGKEVPINDTQTYDNGTGIIPTYLLEPLSCDKDNYKELLIDSGYYTEADLAS